MKNFISLLLFLFVFANLYSQEIVKGKVVFEDSGISYPIGGSSIYIGKELNQAQFLMIMVSLKLKKLNQLII